MFSSCHILLLILQTISNLYNILHKTMLNKLPFYGLCLSVLAASLLQACSGKSPEQVKAEAVADSIAQVKKDSVEAFQAKYPGDTLKHTASTQEIIDFIKAKPDASKYEGGVIYSAAKEAPEYAAKLLNSKYDKFIVVDKASMHVILYDKYGHVIKSYGMACARNYGTKHRKADSRTPEGFFSVEGKYNSTDWLYTDDNGVTHPGRGAFGPRFIRLKIPTTSQIGIHGTSSRGSIGRRASHGCIRLWNENILELVDLVEVGMPVIVLPGPKDREVNRAEGYNIAYFPTGEEYKVSDSEKNEKVNPVKKNTDETKAKPHVKNSTDSISNSSSNSKTIENAETEKTESKPKAPVAPKDSI